MKNRSRLTALLLALLMLMSALPVPALADDVITTMDDYQDAMQRLKDALNEPSIPQEQENAYTITRSAQIDTIVRETITGVIAEDGDNTFTLPVAGKLMLSTAEAAEAYQWQINADGVWANIVGDSAAEIALTYAKIQNALSGGAAIVRCALTRGGEVSYSPEAIVAVDMTPKTETTTVEETIPAVSFYAPAAQSQARALNADVLANEDQDTYSIVINYVFESGSSAANSYTARIAKGSDFKQTVTSPAVLGYTPNKEKVEFNITNIQADVTETVTYKPALVEYTVKHYQQNIDDDKYTLAATETKTGYTEADVGANLATTYEGFTALLYDTTTKIAADGSTVVEIYYDRNYYLLTLDLNGGYGVDPIYAKYGAPISVDTSNLKKAGYTFDGWDKPIPATMPAENLKITAQWKAGGANYTIQYWQENANDDDYSYFESVSARAEVGSKVSGSNNKNYTGFTYDHADTDVVVKGDGSTVVNVYYKRNIYEVRFMNGKVNCGKEEHSHTHNQCCTKTGFHLSCNTKKCPVGYEHSHSSSCYEDLIISAKYGAFIGDQWPGYGWYVDNSGNTAQSYLAVMPLGGKKFYGKQTGSQTSTATYYVEVLPGDTGTVTVSDKSYKVHHTDSAQYDRRGLSVTDEERYDIEGFTVNTDASAKNGADYNGAKFYYTRNQYELVFDDQYGTKVTESLPYEQVLSESVNHKNNYTPAYPSDLEEGAYKFGGWYSDPGCTKPVDWNAKMPAAKVVVYAKWEKVIHTVTYAKEEGATPEHTEEVEHGNNAKGYEIENGNYTFVGWFYKDEGDVERAFDLSMSIRRDLNLYAKWSSNKIVPYVIHYALEDGTKVAEDTKGSALAGTTKTFDAKGGADLYQLYQKGYFPTTNSHSLIMDINGTPENEVNSYTFIYVPREKVKYTVKYLEKGTNNVLHTEKKAETSDAVITEKFEPVKGYVPDAYQKRLVLSANEKENVLIFWYTEDDEHAPVQIIHWTQNIAGDGYTEYQSSTNLNGVIGQLYSETPLTIAGFEYNATKSTASGTLTADGLVLNLYYDRIEYPYEFRFLEQGTDKVLEPSVTGKARYQAQVTQTAKDITGYTLVSAKNQAINIAIEDGTTAVNNVRTFYYTEQTVDIKYVVVGPDGCGTLDNYQDSQLKVMTGEVKGSTPTANPGFKFVGWFTDEPCGIRVENVITGAVDATTNKLTPQKRPSDNCHFAATYYAKFEYNLTTLTITKSGAEVDANGNGLDAGQSFLFKVTGEGLPTDGLLIAINGNGSETISGLTVGKTYTVTEVSDWSWRYTAPAEEITLDADANKNVVTVTNTRAKVQWLDGDCYAENDFRAVNSGN